MYGGGIYDKQNKILPGSYFKFRSAPNTGVTFSERGIVAVPMVLNWQGEELVHMQNFEIMNATSDVPQWTRDCLNVFGYHDADDAVRYMREMFRNAVEVFIYPVGTATKASNTFATAAKGGVRGNDLSIVIDTNVDDPGKFDVITLLALEKVDTQTITTGADLVDTQWVTWKKGASFVKTASTPLTGGKNATPNGSDYQKALAAFEQLAFNILICPVTDEPTKKLFMAWTKRMNDSFGLYHQLVAYKFEADSELLAANVSNAVKGADPAALTYYVGGEQAATGVQACTDGKAYTGELEIEPAVNNQADLAIALQSGKYVYHKVGSQWVVLADNNSLTTFTNEKDEGFSRNQTIRVLQQRAIDCTTIFNQDFLGKAGTDDVDHANYKLRLLNHALYLQSIGAIKNFDKSDIQVTQGEQVDSYHITEGIQPNYCVRKVYHDITVSAFMNKR